MHAATDWRTVCRHLAEGRAQAEAMEQWQWQGRNTPVPFAYRWEHVQEVARLAMHLAQAEDATAEQKMVLEAAAWLHDICKLEPEHARAGANEAETILAGTDFPPRLVPAVVDAIAQHEGLTRPQGAPPLTPLEAAVLWDADKLSKIGVGALATNLAAPYDAGYSLARRQQKAAAFARETLSRTVDSMNTSSGRATARKRFATMMAALEAWEDEVRSPVEHPLGEQGAASTPL